MRSAIVLFLLCTGAILARFEPSVRIDHENAQDRKCGCPAITLGRGTGESQPIYVVFEDVLAGNSRDIMFQKSTDGGNTWLPADVLVRQCGHHITEERPDVAVDSGGDIYVVYQNDSLPGDPICCVRSTDGGTTWLPPTRVDDRVRGSHGWVRIAAGSNGVLFCAWNDDRTGRQHIWSSASTDRGATWPQNVRVDDDTSGLECYQADVFVQPGTDHCLVVAQAPCDMGGFWGLGGYLYRSTDMGSTFQPGARFDTCAGGASQPHVVADSQHIICDYSPVRAEARTLYVQPDTWGAPSFMGYTEDSGTKLSISADGRVHAVLVVYGDSISDYRTCYTSSFDHGATWSEPELVMDDTTEGSYDPDIDADSAGRACVVWRSNTTRQGEIWFATRNPAAIAEEPTKRAFSGAFSAEPNPFAKTVGVAWNFPARSIGVVRAYAQDGRLVRQVRIPADEAHWVWDGRDDSGAPLPPGVYVIEAGPGLRAKVVKLK
jgi:hypothetical protein